MAKRKRGEGGFTLIELLVVMAILALLAGIVGSQYFGYLGKARSQTARVQVKAIVGALENYRVEMGGYPTSEQGLKALVTAPIGAPAWDGPYLAQASGLIDPWGQPYLFRVPGKYSEVDVYTLGSDKAEGGVGEAKDVGSW